MAAKNNKSDRNPFIAAFLSLVFTGAGQLYNHQILRGVAFFVGAIIWAVLVGGESLLLALLVPIASAVDAAIQASN